MTTFIAFLEELEQSHQTVELPVEDVERLVNRFGPVVRSMGYRNPRGSVEIPMGNITEAGRMLDDLNLSAAVAQLKSPERFANTLEDGSAIRLIETLASLYLSQFQKRVERFQDSRDPAEADRLWGEITHDLFGA
jgi:hypothetical protein